MNRPPRRVRSPPFCYDPRVMARGADPRPPPDYDDPYATPPPPFDPAQSAPAAFIEHQHPPPPPPQQQQQYPIGFRDHRLPSTYRATLIREAYGPVGNSAPYKILCITNINHKVSDGPVKDALTSDFSRFGDISVSICHDSGERLAYIYFRTYEEAREARHAKARTIFFDRPLEIEPIYDPRASPVDSSPPQHPGPPPQPVYVRRRSMTPPEYYGVEGPLLPPHSGRRPPPPPPIAHHRGMSPLNYTHSSRHPPGPNHSMGPAPPMPYDRGYYMSPPHLPPPSPYSSPPHDTYRSYPPNPPVPHPFAHSSSYHQQHYGPPPVARDRGRALLEGHVGGGRSPRHDPYYPIDHRGYPPPPPAPPSLCPHMSRGSSSLHSSHHHSSGHPSQPPHIHHQASSRRSPPHPDHPRYMSREFRREKYGSDNYSSEPEDGRPSRVLFINNVDSSQTETDLRSVFDDFGLIEEIEIKEITPDVASALIKFSSMDCAYKAKTATNGKYLGSLKCRISYGKVSASRRLWVGGFGPNTTTACLKGEFGRFGNIISLDYIPGRPYAYIEFESANQAQFATHHLKGTFVAEAERRLRIEYVDPVERADKASKLDSSLQVSDISSRSRTTNESWSTNDQDIASPRINCRKRSITPSDISAKRRHVTPGNAISARHSDSVDRSSPSGTADIQSKVHTESIQESLPQETNDKNELNNNQDSSRQSESNKLEVNVPCRSPDAPLDLERLSQSMSIRDIVDCCSISWLSQLVLRNFNFPSRMFMCSGRKATIDKYLNRLSGENGDNCPILRITQRWRLHPQPKLQEVKRRMQSGNLGMLIITSRLDQSPNFSSPSCKTPQSSTSQSGTKQQNGETENPSTEDKTSSGLQNEGAPTQSRPLKNLISYLEQKDAAGVISLNSVDSDETDGSKLLYAFPPGEFALNLLKRKAPNLTPDSTKEEFLLGVIVGGGNETKI